MNKTRFLFASVLFLSTFFMLAQDYQATYTYDAGGNRIQRVIILPNPTVYQAPANNESTPIDDVVSDFDIKIYPNPTKGELSVGIIGFLSSIEGEVLLFDLKGNVLIRKTIKSSLEQLDLGNYPSGTYIMKIRIGEEMVDWKIIKE
jgi:hypothetical protein